MPAAPPTLKGVTPMAPYGLTLFSFLDARGVEQQFTTADPAAAHAYASRHRLVVLRRDGPQAGRPAGGSAPEPPPAGGAARPGGGGGGGGGPRPSAFPGG